MVTIALYAVNEFKASTNEAGLAAGIFIVGAVLGRLYTGRIIDKVGCSKPLFIGLVSFTLTTFLYFGISSLPFLVVNRLLHGIAFGIASTAIGTMVGQVIPAVRRGEGLGYFSMSVILSVAIGPLIGFYLTQSGSFQASLALCLLLCVFSLLAACFMKVPQSVLENAASDPTKGFKMSNFFEPNTIPIAVVTLAVGFGYSSVLPFIALYIIEIELIEATSLFFVVYAIVILLSRPFTGRLFDSMGSNIIMYPSLLFFAVGMLLLSQAHNEFTLLLAGAFIGLGFGNFQSNAQAISVKVSPPHRIGLATSTYFISIEIGVGIGPFLLGFIIPFTGYRGMYLMMGMGVFATIILYYFLHGKKESDARKTKSTQLDQFHKF
jgi:MFS family permease